MYNGLAFLLSGPLDCELCISKKKKHFTLGVSSQELGANDDVKDISVEHSAVLRHRLVAKTNRHIDIHQGMDGLPIPYSDGDSLSFIESF